MTTDPDNDKKVFPRSVWQCSGLTGYGLAVARQTIQLFGSPTFGSPSMPPTPLFPVHLVAHFLIPRAHPRRLSKIHPKAT